MKALTDLESSSHVESTNSFTEIFITASIFPSITLFEQIFLFLHDSRLGQEVTLEH